MTPIHTDDHGMVLRGPLYLWLGHGIVRFCDRLLPAGHSISYGFAHTLCDG